MSPETCQMRGHVPRWSTAFYLIVFYAAPRSTSQTCMYKPIHRVTVSQQGTTVLISWLGYCNKYTTVWPPDNTVVEWSKSPISSGNQRSAVITRITADHCTDISRPVPSRRLTPPYTLTLWRGYSFSSQLPWGLFTWQVRRNPSDVSLRHSFR